ncbi:MAG: acyl CoA:acetate/3-ketoacid CoA transferase [Oscillospiraceae bacterium]|jgi:propionate CoA-transferase|nr:acyl CoA:acetate/3-ketoacid CoA transferase [Oscillospiraceae bacterium]
MAKFITAREAAELIPDGATVGIAGMGLSGWAEEVGCAIRDSFKETGHPRELNLKQGSAMGDWKERGVTRLGEAGPGLVTRWSGAHVGSAFTLRELAVKNALQCHCLPQGVIVNLWREIAAGRPGLLTKVGLGTFVDPRVEGGKMNSCTTDELVALVNFGGEEYLFYKAFKLDAAILRGTSADENGNISFEHESIINEGFSVAAAAKNSGGIVIVQVEYPAKAGTMNPKEVKIPGVLVDYVVVATDKNACWQAEGVYFEPAFSGQIKKPLSVLAPLPFDARKVICRRCAMELRRGTLINLGIGMPADIAKVVAEEGYIDRVTMSTESGMIGGVPSALPNFGSAYNPEATLEHGAMFDLIDGGGLDLTCVGIGEADERGNINVSRFGTRLTGPGGFINITQATGKIIFCGTFMGKATVAVGNGEARVTAEGSIKKFLKSVEQITFAGQYAKPEQDILYVTERCVFRLIDGKMTITEIAPGINLEKDILANMAFTPEIAKDLKAMDSAIFYESWGGLGNTIDSTK